MILALLALLPLATSAPLPVVPAALQDEELPDRRPEVKTQLDELGASIRTRGSKDDDAIRIIEQLEAEFARSGPRDRAAIVDGLSRCFEERRQDLDDGQPDNRLYLAAAKSLGAMGLDASPVLARWISDRRHRGDLHLQRQLVLSLGKTKDPKRTKDLTGLLQNKDAILVAAASEAMANYAQADGRLRKELFSELLKVLMSVKGRMDSDVNDTEARQRYDAIAAPMMSTMQILSGHDERMPPEDWQRWWNKHKRDDWEREQGT